MDTKVDWSKKSVLKLIELWRKYECLYNPKHRLYHNRNARQESFNQIAEKLKLDNISISASEIKNKITYLRGQYTREVSKIQERNTREDLDVYVPCAYWYNELSFLDDFINKRNKSSNTLDQNSVNFENSWDSSHIVKNEVSPQHSKKIRMSNDTPRSSSRATSQVDLEFPVATTILPNVASNAKDEAFCKYIKTELNDITNVNIKDELMETIALAVFNAKKKQRLCHNDNPAFVFYQN